MTPLPPSPAPSDRAKATLPKEVEGAINTLLSETKSAMRFVVGNGGMIDLSPYVDALRAAILRFAATPAAGQAGDERERCAAECDRIAAVNTAPDEVAAEIASDWRAGAVKAASMCAAAIRALRSAPVEPAGDEARALVRAMEGLDADLPARVWIAFTALREALDIPAAAPHDAPKVPPLEGDTRHEPQAAPQALSREQPRPSPLREVVEGQAGQEGQPPPRVETPGPLLTVAQPAPGRAEGAKVERFYCAECKTVGVYVDEDGCCKACGCDTVGVRLAATCFTEDRKGAAGV